MQEHYDNFFEEVFVECEDRYGEIEEMNVCDNLGDHLVGNVYIKVEFYWTLHVCAMLGNVGEKYKAITEQPLKVRSKS